MRQALAVGGTVISHGLFILVLALVGLVIGGLIAFNRIEGLPEREPWQPLGSPPHPVTSLLRIDNDGVYVAAEDDLVYRCCWERSQLPEVPSYPGSHFPCEGSGGKPSPPGNAVERLDLTLCGPDYGVSYALVLLDDGSVWEWSHSSSGIGIFGTLVTYSFCGLGAGFLTGVTVAVWSWRKRRREWKQLQEKEESAAGK